MAAPRKPNNQSRRGGDPASVQALLNAALGPRLKNELSRYSFVLKWSEIVGADIAARSCPDSLRNKTLYVRVADSAWAQELSFQKLTILKRLQRFLSHGEVVEDLHFYVVGKI